MTEGCDTGFFFFKCLALVCFVCYVMCLRKSNVFPILLVNDFAKHIL